MVYYIMKLVVTINKSVLQTTVQKQPRINHEQCRACRISFSSFYSRKGV
ncbi:hypothetical protein FM106_00810 [Brachybacterium faecium]|nr:hypothetical protein FM106_00810 [Brachybacterium faecium]